MSPALDDLPRDPNQLLRHLQQMAEVIARQNASLASLQVERDSFLAERDLIREKHDAAQAEIEKLRLLIRQLQRGQFGRRSERLDPDQLQLGLEDLEQTVATAKLNGVEPLAWLTDVLERMVSGRTKAHELEDLLPWAWKAARAADT
jgi:uncharacterized coiled-coil DUF342 family protein